MPSPLPHPTRRDFLRLCAATATGVTLITPRPRVISVGLDIGTSKTCAAVGGSLADGRLRIFGIGQAPSKGIDHYGVVDSKGVAACVCEALVKAQDASAVLIRRVVLGVVGTKIAPYPDGPSWERMLSWEQPCYTEGGNGILRPVNLEECQATPGMNVVAGAGDRIQAISRCLHDLGVEIEHCTLAPVATASLVLAPEQQRQGALVIDIGAGVTDYAVYAGGKLIHADALARGLEKMEHDSAISSTFRFIRYRLESRGIKIASLSAGVHLAGGGALQNRVSHCAGEVFGRNVRVATVKGLLWPSGAQYVGPPHFSALGLVKWHQQNLLSV